MSENPFEVLKEDMENEEVYLRVNAMHRVKVVATLLG
jgi:serine/threonine-protein phosphatase 2A regulatory subunit A